MILDQKKQLARVSMFSCPTARDLLVCMERKWLQRCLAAVAAVSGLVLFVVVMWRVPWWMDDHYLTSALTPAQATTVSGLRTALVALGAGLLAVAGLVYTHHTLQQTREGHITDRFTKAVEQLGSTVIEVRLGGIYALERIMRDSAKDHATMVEVLAAFVRERGRRKPTAVGPNQPKVSAHGRRVQRARRRVSRPERESAKPTADVQAALTVLGRRPRGRDEPFSIDLVGAHLEGAMLGGAHLSEAGLYGAHLERANLRGAHLERANLRGAHLERANLNGAHLYEAVLVGGLLNGAFLVGAYLEGAMLGGAYLNDANLGGTYLNDANLGGTYLNDANLGGTYLNDANLGGTYLNDANLAGAHLEGANLWGAHLNDANLWGADLRDAAGLMVEQIVAAKPSDTTRLPAELAANEQVRERIRQYVGPRSE
ncbi:pentapeptide repeat-containing protein [Streptomyces purpurascens]|uniref:pentapeptide repeat-containing protein n=1 Tax=Streptomyces purpurascens TaxID=1924 RepID=UPI0033CD3891